MLSKQVEKRMLQAAVSLACIVPISAGLSGAALSNDFLHSDANGDMANHFRYLSGLLLGIGLCFLYSLKDIELHSERFRLLTCIIVVGGFARLNGFLQGDATSTPMQAALVMELLVTPLLCLWQQRVSSRFR